ncbi:hypothetical protein [Kingella denitrificans]|uniref:hypothetical protein n=1 Tax=Kingella denitrificans TaxID=502 RepID=UPI0028D7087F|nr:hypothetical protein [Kingella denitrificans]
MSAKCKLPFGGNGKPTPFSAGEETSSLHTQKSSLHPVSESAGCFLNGGWRVGTVCMALRCHHIHMARHPPPVAQVIAETAKPMFCPAFHPRHKTQKQPAPICKPKPEIQNKMQAAFKPSLKSSLHMISFARCVYSTVFAGS